jgi:hypothetical protein
MVRKLMATATRYPQTGSVVEAMDWSLITDHTWSISQTVSSCSFSSLVKTKTSSKKTNTDVQEVSEEVIHQLKLSGALVNPKGITTHSTIRNGS